MRRFHHLAMLVILLLWSGTASAVTLRLQEKHHGIYGLVLQAARQKGASRARAANILSLVLADNGINFANMNRLPNGRLIRVNNHYLRRSFHPSRQAVRMSKMIFDLPVAQTTARAAHRNAGRTPAVATLVLAPVPPAPDFSRANRAAYLGQLAEKDTKIKALRTPLRSSGPAEFFRGMRAFFARRPFVAAFLHQGLVFAILILVVIFLLAVFRSRYVSVVEVVEDTNLVVGHDVRNL